MYGKKVRLTGSKTVAVAQNQRNENWEGRHLPFFRSGLWSAPTQLDPFPWLWTKGAISGAKSLDVSDRLWDGFGEVFVAVCGDEDVILDADADASEARRRHVVIW